MATYSSIVAWEIPWTEEPGGLQFMGLQRVGLNFTFITFTFFTTSATWKARGSLRTPNSSLPQGLPLLPAWNTPTPYLSLLLLLLLSHFSRVQPFCDPTDCSPLWDSPGKDTGGAAMLSSRDQTHISCVSCIGRWVLYH